MRASLFAVLLVAAGCSSPMPMPKQGGPADGGADTHCKLADGGVIKADTSASSCHPATDGGTTDAGTDMPSYGETLFNAEGEDDDCKYHVKWSATNITNGGDATFVATVTKRADNSAAKGAAVYTEVFLSSTHPAAKSGDTSTESPDGTYTIKNVRFDASGRWTVRFHIFGDCEDTLDDSPHGHAAFYVDVP